MATTNVTQAQANAGLHFANGARWIGNITYSIPGAGAAWIGGYGDGEPFNAHYGVFNATQATNFRKVMALWDSYIAPSITEASDATPGQIRVAFTDASTLSGSPGIAGYAYSPPVGGTTAENGDVWIDETFKLNAMAQGTSAFELLLHEVGHALGLKHPFEGQPLPAGYDSKTYTVMSYTSEDNFFTWSGGGGNISYSTTSTVSYTPMVLDIMAMQSRYGADTTTATGNTVHTLTNADLNGRRSIYDAGGIDTLDLSALTRGSNVDLTPGGYSDLAYYNVEDQIRDLTATYGQGFANFIRTAMTDPNRPAYEWERNLGIAFSTVIENVIGSASADTIRGNAVANTLEGRNGDDTLFGLGGNDTLLGGQGVDTIHGGIGKDLITGGGGLDRFIYNVLADSPLTYASRDVINTFAHGDKIDLSLIDANTGAAGNQAFSFIGASAFTGLAGQLRYDMNNISVTGVKAYLVSADTNGDRVADFSLQIYTSPTTDRTGQPQTWNMAAWDFIL